MNDSGSPGAFGRWDHRFGQLLPIVSDADGFPEGWRSKKKSSMLRIDFCSYLSLKKLKP